MGKKQPLPIARLIRSTMLKSKRRMQVILHDEKQKNVLKSR
jgi:hypothetical protein